MRDRTVPRGAWITISDAFAALVTLAYAAYIAVRGVRLQWDFRVYLDAAHAALQGLDPYVLENLARVSGRPSALPFLYPPAALLPFALLAQLPLPAALAFWMSLKFALLVWLVALWKREFVPRAPWSALALVVVFGSNAAALWDLRSGNVALVEAALIWTGLAFWVRGRAGVFAALIVAAAVFKLLPAVFLLLLFVPVAGRRPPARVFLCALLALLLVIVLPAHLGPAAGWRRFLHVGQGPFPTGEANPSLFAFLVWRAHGVTTGVFVLWGAAAAGIVLAFARLLRAKVIARNGRAVGAATLALAAVTIYVLAHPRPMAYGFVLAGAAIVWLVRRAVPTALARAGLIAIVCAQGLLWAAQRPWTGALAAYAPWIVLAVLAALAAVQGNLQAGESGRGGAKPAG
jgi:hypothetical protein